jgi:hypothetical protein
MNLRWPRERTSSQRGRRQVCMRSIHLGFPNRKYDAAASSHEEMTDVWTGHKSIQWGLHWCMRKDTNLADACRHYANAPKKGHRSSCVRYGEVSRGLSSGFIDCVARLGASSELPHNSSHHIDCPSINIFFAQTTIFLYMEHNCNLLTLTFTADRTTLALERRKTHANR